MERSASAKYPNTGWITEEVRFEKRTIVRPWRRKGRGRLSRTGATRQGVGVQIRYQMAHAQKDQASIITLIFSSFYDPDYPRDIIFFHLQNIIYREFQVRRGKMDLFLFLASF